MASAEIEKFAEWIRSSGPIVAFSGAGISTESGIPDFRSPGGIWSKSQPVYFDDFLASDTARREYWRQKSIAHRDFAGASPNAGHRVLADWERRGLVAAVITQNIDGLHQLAGSERVLELHGTAREIGCLRCEARFSPEPIIAEFESSGEPPLCPKCGGLLKHATVSFGQNLPQDVLAEALDLARSASFFLTLGSSLVVEPAASLPRIAHHAGAKLVIINRDPTPQDDSADAVIHGSIGEALTAIDAVLKSVS